MASPRNPVAVAPTEVANRWPVALLMKYPFVFWSLVNTQSGRNVSRYQTDLSRSRQRTESRSASVEP